MSHRQEAIETLKVLVKNIKALDALAKSAKIGGAMLTHQRATIESLRSKRTAGKLLILLKVVK